MGGQIVASSGKSPAYLTRSRHGIWYFRLVVPPYAQERIGKKVIKRSLKTRSKREAILKASGLLLEASRLIGRFSDTQPMPLAVGPGRGVAALRTVALAERQQVRTDSHAALSVSRWTDCEAGQPQTVPGTCSVQPNPLRSPAKRLSEVLESYRKQQELEGVSLKTLDDKQAVINLLIRVVGDLPITDYTIESVKQFRETALQLPPLATRTLAQKPNMTLAQLIEKADKTISITTYNNYVKNLVTVFEYAISMEMIVRNPFSGMKLKQKRKASSYRDEFTKEEIEKIFLEVRQQKGWKYWIPLLGYYGAFRLNEVCQLYKDDVKTIKGVPCIHIREGRPDQRLKTVSSERLIPIHDDLIKLGFIDYVDSIPDNSRLFPVRWNDKHGYSAAPSKWFGRLRVKLGIRERGKGRKDFHSFRHTVANRLKQKGLSENQIGGILGHSTGGITNTRYGKEYRPEVLKPFIDMVESVAEV